MADIIQRVRARGVPLSEEVAAQVQFEVRGDWGGERHYIAKVGECGKLQLTARDRQIRADANRGERVALLARRYGLSKKRIWQILGG